MHFDEGRPVLFVDLVPLSLQLWIIRVKVLLITYEINNSGMASCLELSPNWKFQLTLECKYKISRIVYLKIFLVI